MAEGKSWKHIATGDILRANRREGTPLGQQAQQYMDAGELVPDELIVAMVKETLGAMPAERGVVFDGFPRTVPQAEALDLALEQLGRKVDRVEAPATLAASSARCKSSRITTNSSPPRRATVSSSRTVRVSRSATRRSTASPTGWPRLSLIFLKWSRSRNNKANW